MPTKKDGAISKLVNDDGPDLHHGHVALILVFVLIFAALAFDIAKKQIDQIQNPTCGDGTFYDKCSLIKPYFCSEGNLVNKASGCGCPEGMRISEEQCFSKYTINSKEVELNYILKGEKYAFNYTVYGGLANYLSKLTKDIYNVQNQTPLRTDFKMKSINELEQRKLLLALVAKIRGQSNDPEEQIRIAVSLVQNIPYNFSNKTAIIGGSVINYSRYPYEVLYDNEGICGEKSELLAFLLKEMGYKTAILYYAEENHEAVGIGCPVEESIGKSGYCFIETTGPAILSDDKIEYVGGITLKSEPEILQISDGKTIGKDWSEYKDAKLLDSIRRHYVPFESLRLKHLERKYGLVQEYRVA